MVCALNSSSTRAYDKQTARDMKLAEILVTTPTSRLKVCNRQEKAQYIRGLEGLRQYRAMAVKNGNRQMMEDIDAHIARIKGAWTLNR